ncbi:unnamed protein product [Spirodela intermedia]|uniref:Uncharacterized protein n=1 Tax=Spirodela intermedia TaxID=51605 RepID=A0A7I8J2Y5_SPIIN|nr:unnamed protein product [Spirodela intermedia]CAA6664488.1 unnamed protein product [Spirodela intermedia]
MASAAGEEGTVRFGIIGCAMIARKLSRAIGLAPNAAVVAVGSRSLEKSRRFLSDNGLDAAPSPPTVATRRSSQTRAWTPSTFPSPPASTCAGGGAAASGKHLLLEKPAALCAADLDEILAACDAAGVQFMDSTMWMHHPRTAAMRELLSDPVRFGKLRTVNSIFTFVAGPSFLENDIRVKPELDGLGALGDVGWYCIRGILWAVDYELPESVVALRRPVTNAAGVILSCGASLVWKDGQTATFHCSFLANMTIELTAVGSAGTLHAGDFVIPAEERSAAFSFSSCAEFSDLHTSWGPLPSRHVVSSGLPQEAQMVAEFSRLVGGIRGAGGKPEKKWPDITRKTQLVVDAVKASIERGFEPVVVGS